MDEDSGNGSKDLGFNDDDDVFFVEEEEEEDDGDESFDQEEVDNDEDGEDDSEGETSSENEEDSDEENSGDSSEKGGGDVGGGGTEGGDGAGKEEDLLAVAMATAGKSSAGGEMVIEEFLSKEEIFRVEAVFRHVSDKGEMVTLLGMNQQAGNSNGDNDDAAAAEDNDKDNIKNIVINEEQFTLALALLGQRERVDKVRALYLTARTEFITIDHFKKMIVMLRSRADYPDLQASIRDAYDALYEGTCEQDTQRDEFGEKYLLVRDLREVLTALGNKLTDEEAAEIISECHPVTEKRSDGTIIEKIYYQQYRAMLLDQGM